MGVSVSILDYFLNLNKNFGLCPSRYYEDSLDQPTKIIITITI